MAGTKRTGTPRITPRNAKNAVAVAKVIGPAVAPVLLPFMAKAAASLRGMRDTRRAHKLGVPVDDLAKFTGKGATLHARIAGLTGELTELRDSDQDFVEESRTTLVQLTSAVRAAERMPAPRRKFVHRAVSNELDLLERRLLHKLGL
ncbi:DUF6474 family protein [Actinocrispum wychmicini]|uniref:Uncharacterized protein n=1 Tax=Actinocrispum wychmicini TaxID=1213861 RepID=A0A4V2S8N4_9PSEU|nr:DUF6474 family protein [Actinocrispum wychmicini]TCO64610.1 hypothetical protein EV192_101387 [Actinocrispum wychmicini]